MKLLITVPTYNEAENIESFIKLVFDTIPEYAEMLVIDDNSPDGTSKIVERLSKDYPGTPQKHLMGSPGRLHILKRSHKAGLAAAYLAAFEWGMSRDYDVFLEMDADFSHNPEYILPMLEKIRTFDVVAGSRNISGGGIKGWSFFRNLISKGGSLYSRMVLNCPIKDLTGGFNMWTRQALEKINLESIISAGYSFQIEMKYKAYRAGCAITEIPIIFEDRKNGVSKMSKKIFFEALLNIWKIRQSGGVSDFIKFAITGGLGSVTNLVIFFLFVDLLGLHEIPVSIFCFLIAATQNYIINHRWSFKRYTGNDSLSFKKWSQFIISSLLGLAVNILTMKLLLWNFSLPYKFIAQGLGIAAGMVINFFVSKFCVFKNR